MNKRAIAILGAMFILIVGTLGFLIYQRQHKAKVAQETTQTEQQVPEAQPAPSPQPQTPAPDPQAGGKAIKLTDDSVISPVLFYQGNGVSYFNSQGQLFQTDIQASGASVLLSNKRELTIALKSGISRILWPQRGNDFIAEFANAGKRTWSWYDSAKGVYVDFPPQITAVSWMPSGDRIMVVWVEDNGKAGLYLSNLDGSQYEKISDLYEPDDDISVSPDGKNLLFWRLNNREARNVISLLGAQGAYKAVVPDGYNMGANWSPDSGKFLFGRRDSQGTDFQLWMADLASGQVKNLNVKTVPEKAVWSKDGSTVFAAVPTRGSTGQGLTEDTIVKINTATTDQQEFNPGIAVDAGDLFLSSSEETLFFKNNQDRALYYISLVR